MATTRIDQLSARTPVLTDFLPPTPSGGPSGATAVGDVLALVTGVCQGRLTLTTGVPVTVADVTGATTIYFTPFRGNAVAVYNGTKWKLYALAEISLALGTLTSGANYDVFVYDVAGALTLKFGPAWSSNTARGTGAGTTELTLQDGVYVNAVAITSGPAAKAGRYLGTFRTTATTTTEDSYGGASQAGGKRFLWNAYNRVQRPAAVIDTTDSWTYSTATWRQANGAAGNKVEYVCGLSEDMVTAFVHGFADNSNINGATVAVGVGVDSTSTSGAKLYGGIVGGPGLAVSAAVDGSYQGYPGIGYHALNWVEISTANATTTWRGDNGGTLMQSGLEATLWA